MGLFHLVFCNHRTHVLSDYVGSFNTWITRGYGIDKMSKITLYKHQQDNVDKKYRRHLYAWETGTGKTYAAIRAAEQYPGLIIVICPKSLLENWLEEISDCAMDPSRFFVITKETFKRDWESLIKYDTIIVDEAHYFFGMTVSGKTSGMSKSLFKYKKKWMINSLFFLTATPWNGKNPWIIFRLCQLMGYMPPIQGKDLSTFLRFRAHFCFLMNIQKRVGDPITFWKEKDIAFIKDDIISVIKSHGSVKRMDECVDIPEKPIYKKELFDLTKEQRRAILGITEPLPIQKFTKEYRICGGTIDHGGYAPNEFFNTEKTDRVLELIEDNKKLSIICKHRLEVEHLINLYKKTKGSKKCFVFDGATKNLQEQIKEVNSMDECVIFINAFKSEGYNLWSVPLMVFYSFSWSLKDYVQMIGRIQRINKIKKNVYLFLITRESIDSSIFYNIIVKKRDFQAELYRKTGEV